MFTPCLRVSPPTLRYGLLIMIMLLGATNGYFLIFEPQMDQRLTVRSSYVCTLHGPKLTCRMHTGMLRRLYSVPTMYQ